MPGFVFGSRWDFEPVFVFPQPLRLHKIDSMFFEVGLALRSIKLEIHTGIKTIPTWSRVSTKEGFDRLG